MKVDQIDWVLKELQKHYPLGDSIGRFHVDLNISQKEILEIEEYLKNNGYIEMHGDFDKKLTYWGKGILESYGSLENYLQYLEQEKLEKEERFKISHAKESYELKHLKWLNKTRWLPLIVATISLIISLLAILKTFGIL